MLIAFILQVWCILIKIIIVFHISNYVCVNIKLRPFQFCHVHHLS